MYLFWRIRYLDNRDNQFKDRDLWLNTDTLDPVTKAAVEATHALRDTGRGREMLRFRHLFQEHQQRCGASDAFGTIFLYDYFEDETGKEISYQQMGFALTGDPQAAVFPPGTRPHDAEYWLAEKPPIHLDQITLSADEVNILGYFIRDLRELKTTALLKDGPGSISGSGSIGRWVLKTAVSDEEIRSFVTIFRRLYMEKEPANFNKAVAVFARALQDHPVSAWVQAIATEYDNSLENEPDSSLMIGLEKLPFSRKRLIDVYLYTQYAHQPDDRRVRQFNECLAAVGGNRSLLTWLFLTEMWKCAIEMCNAGAVIAEFYDHYCRCHNISSEVLASIRSDHPGLGSLEKKEVQEARVLQEKAKELAKALWESAGRPEGGPAGFIKPALEQLIAATTRGEACPPSDPGR
jgi:hypothetical protein